MNGSLPIVAYVNKDTGQITFWAAGRQPQSTDNCTRIGPAMIEMRVEDFDDVERLILDE